MVIVIIVQQNIRDGIVFGKKDLNSPLSCAAKVLLCAATLVRTLRPRNPTLAYGIEFYQNRQPRATAFGRDSSFFYSSNKLFDGFAAAVTRLVVGTGDQIVLLSHSL